MPLEIPPNGRRRILGVAVVTMWLAVFAAGVLIPSQPHRIVLGWKPANQPTAPEQAQIKSFKAIEERINKLEQSLNPSAQPLASSAPPLAVIAPDPEPPPKPARIFWAFLVATFTFIPLNVALLSILAAFLGGCTVSNQVKKEVQREHDALPEGPEKQLLGRRLHYLSEEPIFSAMRGLVVFLLLASGLFVFAGSDSLVTSDDQRDALAMYVKYAGLFSFIAYLAGHDPTLFSSLLRLGSGPLHRESERPARLPPVTPPQQTERRARM